MAEDVRFTLNFAHSSRGGGLKRLLEFSREFARAGISAHFLIHPACAAQVAEFKSNRYTTILWPKSWRLFSDSGYLAKVAADLDPRGVYYSYGVALGARLPGLNWCHISNVLPFAPREAALGIRDRVTQWLLGQRLRSGLQFADVISAESLSSLRLLPQEFRSRFFHSPNGNDDELQAIAGGNLQPVTEEIATVVGTQTYKALEQSWAVFSALRGRHPGLRLQLVGDPGSIPAKLRRDSAIDIRGMLPRSEVLALLKRSRYYVSTTQIENSFNAAAEGIFLSEVSYISDIGPHRELLEGEAFQSVHFSGVDRPLLGVKRGELLGQNLRSWQRIVTDTVARALAAR